MAGGLLKSWGLGVELVFNAGRAMVNMDRTGAKVAELRSSFGKLGSALGNLGTSLAGLGALITPAALGFGLLVGHGSQLAADLEAQALTMRVMLGDAAKAEELIGLIRRNAAATPFEEGDLIEGSKRLLRLTKDNVGRNMELLGVMETMAALNPTKSVVDATEALLDAASGGGFERLKEFGLAFRAEDFAKFGRPGGEAWANAVADALKAEMAKLTKGQDIVGMLSQTFTGRLSTLKDGFNALAREVGEVWNREIGPLVGPLTDRLLALGPAFRQAAEEIATVARRVLGPVLEQVVAWWDTLGADGQAQLVRVGLAVGALAAVLVPIGGALGGVVLAITALAGVVSAAWPVITAAGSAIGALLAPEVLIPIGLALAAVAGGAALLFATFRKEGETPLAMVVRLGRALWDGLIQAITYARAAWGSFSDGFLWTFGGFQGLLDQVGPPLRDLVARLQELGIFATGDGVDLDTWYSLGEVFGSLANAAIRGLTAGLRLAISVMDVLITTFRPFIVAISVVMDGLIGLVSGTMGVGEAFKVMARGLMGIVSALFNGIYGVILGAIELTIRQVVAMVATLPGMGEWAAQAGTGLADKLATSRQELERGISNAIAGVDLAANARAREQAAASSTTVNVAPAAVENTVNVEATVKVDSSEIARASGKAAVRAGQRQGQELPAQARGKVLRGGGTVGILGPAEVL